MSEINPIPYAEPSTGLPPAPTKIVAVPSNWYRGKRLLLSLGLIGWGLWSIHDGFYKYPAENEAARIAKKTAPHSPYDAPGNQILGIALPPIGLMLLCWTLYQSRGTYELDGETLTVPGHPPIPLSAIQTVDRRKWDRKGIAWMTYKIGEESGEFLIDDFIYDRDSTDAIFKRIETAVSTPA